MSKIKNKFKKIMNKISNGFHFKTNKIESIIKINEKYLNTEEKNVNQLIDSINGITTFTKNEIPSIYSPSEELEHAYNLIQTERNAKIDAFNVNILIPLKELSEDLNNLKEALKNNEKSQKMLEKIKKKLENQKSKSEEKKSFEKIEKYEIKLRNVERLYANDKVQVDIFKKVYEENRFQTIKNIYTSLIEMEYNFHQKNLQIINNLKKTANLYGLKSEKDELLQQQIPK